MAHSRTPEFPKPYEHPGHIGHGIPAWLGRHWKSLSLVAATFIGGVSLYLAKDNGPQNPPRQPTTSASDPINKPDLGIGVVMPQETATSTPPPEPTKKLTPEPDPTKAPVTPTIEQPTRVPVIPTKAPATPEINYVEKAIKEGKIELKGEQDIEKYFILITPKEAEDLLNQANNNMRTDSDYTFLLNFDPRQAPNLIMSDIEFNMPQGKSTAIGIKNLPLGIVLGPGDTGDAKVMSNTAVGGTLSMSALVDKGRTHLMIVARRENTENLQPLNKTVPVNIDTKLFAIGNTLPLGFFSGKQQVVLRVYHDPSQIYVSSIKQLLRENNKIAFISSTGK